MLEVHRTTMNRLVGCSVKRLINCFPVFSPISLTEWSYSWISLLIFVASSTWTVTSKGVLGDDVVLGYVRWNGTCRCLDVLQARYQVRTLVFIAEGDVAFDSLSFPFCYFPFTVFKTGLLKKPRHAWKLVERRLSTSHHRVCFSTSHPPPLQLLSELTLSTKTKRHHNILCAIEHQISYSSSILIFSCSCVTL